MPNDPNPADIRLRGLTREDLPALFEWYQDRRVADRLVGGYRLRGRDEAISYMQKWLEPSSATFRLIIVDAADQRLGLTILSGIDLANRSAELSIFIGPQALRGKGLGKAAVRLLLDHAFLDIGLNRVELRVLDDNVPAMRVYEACGFVAEGRMRQAAFKQGRFADVILMSILAEDHRRLQPATASATT